MLNLEMLEELVAFADYGTLSRAAEMLHISQPSLSRSMQKLEDELQVDLFDHGKNRLTLNETGEYAVGYARKLLEEAGQMEDSVQSFDRRQNTIAVGSAAPAPLWNIAICCSQAFPGKSLTTELKDETSLLQGLLAKDLYQLIVLPYPVEDSRCGCFFYEAENLMLCIPKTHPLASRESVRFADFDGESMIVFSQIGFWDSIHRRNLPDSHFIMQNDQADVHELADNSDLPTFITDLSLAMNGMYGKNRVAVPISDEDAHAEFYCVYRKDEEKKLRPLLKQLRKAGEENKNSVRKDDSRRE